MRFLTRSLVGFAILGTLVGISRGVHGACGFDWTQIYPDSATVQLESRTWWDDNGTARDTISVRAARGPIIAGTCTITATVESANADLTSIRLLIADDSNGNGTIDAGEWSQVASASASPWGSGGTRAQTAATTVSATKAAYRIEHVWTWGTSTDDILDCSLN